MEWRRSAFARIDGPHFDNGAIRSASERTGGPNSQPLARCSGRVVGPFVTPCAE
jgi:hypothetical protein